jgi:hypothetical protein
MPVVTCPSCDSRYDPGIGDELDDRSDDISVKVICPACGQWLRLPENEPIDALPLPPEILDEMMAQSTLIGDGFDEDEKPRPRRRKKSSRRKGSRRKGTQKAAAEKNSMDAAIRRALKRMSSYYHPDCKTRTEVSEDIIAMAVLDPWAFPLSETECVGCGLAPMKDAWLTKRTTVYDAFMELRAEVPFAGKFARFCGIPLIFSVVIAIASLLLPIEGGAGIESFLVFAFIGFAAGFSASGVLFRMLRRNGLFW